MKVQINFKLINPDFSQEYANQYQEGKESESNWKYSWAVGYELKDVKSVSLIENEDYVLRGKLSDSEFEFHIPNVLIYRCEMENGTKEDFAVSKSVINKTHQANNEKYKTTRFYFYINEKPSSVELGKNLIVDEKDIPKELLTKSEK